MPDLPSIAQEVKEVLREWHNFSKQIFIVSTF